MKTILYQPLFINPLAYFVFPLLYHIEKGDSYIEPANITGLLIISDLTKSLTLTPTINTVQDTNQVDFGLFKGKHIRISQYTNIGAVVLGEWYIPGTPTPPEPEQPDWFKESIVAWYSPYCKQGMTNYDVIESYLIDLTRGVINSEHGDASINGLKINITNIKVKAKDIFAIIPGKTEYTLKLHVSGQTKTNQTRLIYQTKDNKYISHYLNNGINTLWLTNVAWIAIEGLIVGECNITIAQLPTSILKDFSGNNHDAYLHGFKGKLDSGIGIYKIDFSKTLNASAFDNFERLNNKVIAKGNYSGNWNVFGEYDINGIVKNKVAIKITGLNNIKEKLSLEYGYFTTDSKYIKNIILIDKDGIYTYDLNDIIIPDGSNIAHTVYNRMYFGEQIINDINLIVEEIPDYSNQLCYDGKSYGVAYDIPILTDYTIIANRTWFVDKQERVFMSKAAGQNGAFIFEYKTPANNKTYSYYQQNDIVIDSNNKVVYQTKNSYNGTPIYAEDKQDADVLYIGNIRVPDNRSFVGCHGDILLFNRSLTKREISWVKNNLMCSKPQEPDENNILRSLVVHYNVSRQGSANIKSTSTLTDYSGNNRHATCKNFDWNSTEFVDEGKAMRLDGNGSCIVGINMPQLDKYTVIAKRRWIDKKSENKWFCSLGSGDYTSASQSLFWFEGGLLNNVFYTYNRGYKNPIVLPELISILSSDDYNGTRINASNGIQAENKLFIGSVGENDNTHVVADFYQLLLFDRVLTDVEREWVKENLIEPDIISASKACSALFEPENLEITDEFPNGVIRDSLGGNYYLLPHSNDYTIENGLIKSTDSAFLVSVENANENEIKAIMVDMYYDSTVPGSYLNGEYTEDSVKLLNRRIMGINNPTTTSIFQDLMLVLETGFTIGKIALYNRELNKDEFDSEAFHKGFAVRHSTFEKNASTHLFREGHKELVPGEYLLPFETLYLRVDVPDGYTMQNYVFDGIEQDWKPGVPKAYMCPEHNFHIITKGELLKVIKNWSPLASISTFSFKATDNLIQFAGSTDGGTMKYILDDTDITKFTILYTNTEGKGNVYLMIGNKLYDVISGQPQTYNITELVTLDFLNTEEVTNFAGTIKFTNIL